LHGWTPPAWRVSKWAGEKHRFQALFEANSVTAIARSAPYGQPRHHWIADIRTKTQEQLSKIAAEVTPRGMFSGFAWQ
jgi:hypothetical protein